MGMPVIVGVPMPMVVAMDAGLGSKCHRAMLYYNITKVHRSPAASQGNVVGRTTFIAGRSGQMTNKRKACEQAEN
jgi:hypothetical protein